MNKKIYSLLKKYNSKELDDNFINEVFRLMLEEDTGLSNYIKSFEISNYSDLSYGMVDHTCCRAVRICSSKRGPPVLSLHI